MTPAPRPRLGNVIAMNERGAAFLEELSAHQERERLRREFAALIALDPATPAPVMSIMDLFKKRD